MTESSNGSHLAEMRTCALNKGDHWLLDGTKTSITIGILITSSRSMGAAKLVARELEGRVMEQCVQSQCGAGYMYAYRICRMHTYARISSNVAGTSEIVLEIIGDGFGLDERKLNEASGRVEEWGVESRPLQDHDTSFMEL